MVVQLHICLLLIILLPALKVVMVKADAPIARSGCNDTCGDVKIPFPFGIGANCFLDHWFEINCTSSPNSDASLAKPFLSKFNIEVMEVTLNSPHGFDPQTVVVGIPPLNVCAAATPQTQQLRSIDLRRSPYQFSTQYNVFIMEGCPGSAYLFDQNKTFTAGCGTVCDNNNPAMIPTNSCYGFSCCQAPLSFDDSFIPFYHIDFNPQDQSCLLATLIRGDSVNQYAGKLSSSVPYSVTPVVLSWSWISSLSSDYDSHASCGRQDDNTLTCECDRGRNSTLRGNHH